MWTVFWVHSVASLQPSASPRPSVSQSVSPATATGVVFLCRLVRPEKTVSAALCGLTLQEMVRHNARLSSIASHVVPAAAEAEVESLTKILMDDTMNKNLMEMEYAVRGELVIKAGQYWLRSIHLFVSCQLGSASLGATVGFVRGLCAGLAAAAAQ